MPSPAQVFRAIMVANGDRDPEGSAQGMLENCPPGEIEYVTAIAAKLTEIEQAGAVESVRDPDA